MIDIEKIAKRLVPKENLAISYAPPGVIPCFNCITNFTAKGKFFEDGFDYNVTHGEELSRRIILLNKRDKNVNNMIYLHCLGSQSSLYRYINKAKIIVNSLNLKKWAISIEIHALYYFTIFLIRD